MVLMCYLSIQCDTRTSFVSYVCKEVIFDLKLITLILKCFGTFLHGIRPIFIFIDQKDARN